MRKTGKYARTFVLAFAAMALAVAGVSMTPLSWDQSLAAEGCCMKRQCPDDSCTWYVTPGDYKSCTKLNERDGDDVDGEEGLIWWSPNC